MDAIGSDCVGEWVLLDLLYPCLGCYSGGFVWFEGSFNGVVVVVGSVEVLVVLLVVTYGCVVGVLVT
jgi:hypothetical protein